MIKFTTYVTIANVAVTDENGKARIENPYTTGKVKIRAFQKLVNAIKKDTNEKAMVAGTLTIKLDVFGEETESIQSAVERALKAENFAVSYCIPNDDYIQDSDN